MRAPQTAPAPDRLGWHAPSTAPAGPPAPGRTRPAASRTVPQPRETAGIAAGGIHGIKVKGRTKRNGAGNGREKREMVSRETVKPCLSWNNSKVIHCRNSESGGLSGTI